MSDEDIVTILDVRRGGSARVVQQHVSNKQHLPETADVLGSMTASNREQIVRGHDAHAICQRNTPVSVTLHLYLKLTTMPERK